jgi:aryl-alcohol dehydrogenase-like predicted oxidoreductase
VDVRNLGSAGLVSSAMGLGTRAFTGAYGPVSKRQCGRVIRLALDMGVTMIDTVGLPPQPEIETLLGETIARRRRDALLATHAAPRLGPPDTSAVPDGASVSLAMACEASLRRLRTDYIDLFYLSSGDPHVPVEEAVGQLGDLVAEGKIRYLGLRDVSPDELRRAHAIHPVSALGVGYSLHDRSAEGHTMAMAAELGIGIVACRPLARGLLAASATVESSPELRIALGGVAAEAAELDLGMARLCLAWLLGWRSDIVPVPSTRNPVHMEMNASVSQIRLAPGVCARLAQLFPSATGGRSVDEPG